MSKPRGVIVSCILALTATTAFAATAAAAGPSTQALSDWSTAEKISDVTMDELASAVDSDGHVYVVGAHHLRHQPLYFLTNESGAWTQAELVQSPRRGAITNVGIAVDQSDDSVWIVYSRWSFWNPCYFTCPPGGPSRLDGHFLINNVGGSWSDPERLPGPYLDVRWSFDVRDGVAHIAYDKFVGGASDSDSGFIVRYANNASGDWTSRRVGRGWGPFLELGDDGDIWIAYTAKEYAGGVLLAHASGPDSAFTKSFAPGSAADIETAVVDGLGLNGAGRPVAIFDRYEDGEGYWTYWVRLGPDGWTEPHRLVNQWTNHFEMIGTRRMHILYAVDDDTAAEGLYYGTSERRLARTIRISRTTRHVEDAPAAADSLAVDDEGRPHVVFAVPYDDDDGDGTWYRRGPMLD